MHWTYKLTPQRKMAYAFLAVMYVMYAVILAECIRLGL